MIGLRVWARATTAAVLLVLFAFSSLQVRAEEATETEAAKESAAAVKTARGNVIEAVITTGILDGGPTDYRSEIDNTVPEVFFYTELESLEGQTVTHRWKYKGKVMATAKFDVKSSRQKVWSSNKMMPEWTGAWLVEVVNGSGTIIDRGSFSYLEPL